ncbi:START domain-containing protein [Flavobacteriaceae bacterium M23B6Z8]
MKMYWLAFFVFGFVTVANAQNWELKKNKNGIQVYTRSLDSTRINEYKAVVLSNTTVEKALKVILDGDNLWKWNHKTSESKTVSQISNSEFIFWMKNDLPWPVKNRDNVSYVKVREITDGYWIDILPGPSNLVAEQEGTIRMTNFKGHWSIIKKDKSVQITQQLYGDPEGSLPSWLLNSILTTAPFHSFCDLKELLEK